ncbi:ParA family protein [Oryzibacter oryziterrae]|uniref:ParA family protein n=1 Tax=Oryzibacter oryziterrae TaxID=2766474 RepID=UPI001F3C4262|nr:ParA family protein [Oryzibacter oryziterrae]
MGQQTNIFAVANRKGGTGKSTTVVNLASEFATRGRRVLVVDLDPQGHAGLGFDVVANRGDLTIHRAMRDRLQGTQIGIRRTQVPGIDVLPAERDFDSIQQISQPRRLAETLSEASEDYDLVFIDTPPASPQLLILALMASTGVLVPTLLEHLALDGVRQFVAAYHRVVATHNLGLAGLLVVPTRVDLRSNMQKDVLGRMLTGFGLSQMCNGVRIDAAVPEAFGEHVPLLRHRPKARAVEDFARLADDVLRHFPTVSAAWH